MVKQDCRSLPNQLFQCLTSGRYSISQRRQFTHFLIFFQFGADANLIMNLNRTLFPAMKQTNFLLKCFRQLNKIVDNPFERYILIDGSQQNKLPDNLRIRSNIFANDPIFFMLDE